MNPESESSTLRRVFGCRAFWICVAISLIYIFLASTLPTHPLLELVRIMQATGAMMVVVAWAGEAWSAAIRNKKESSDPLIIGVWLQHFSLLWLAMWLLLWRLSGRPEWMLDTAVFGFFSGWLSSFASGLHIWAPGVLRVEGDGEIPPNRIRLVALVAGAGMFTTLIVLMTQPSAQWLIDTIRPYIR